MSHAPIACSIGTLALAAGCAASAPPPCPEPASPATMASAAQPAPPPEPAKPAEPPSATVAPEPPRPEQKVVWPRITPDQHTGVIDPQPINDALVKACGSWRFDDLVLQLMGADPGPERTKLEIELYAHGKRAIGGGEADEARVFVQREGLLDDSVGGDRYYLTLKLKTKDQAPHRCAGWFVEQGRAEWRCVRGKEQGRWVRHWCP